MLAVGRASDAARAALKSLSALVRARSTTPEVALRCRVVIMGLEGATNAAIARALGVSRPTVIRYRQQFESDGVGGLTDEAPLRRRGLDPRTVEAIVDKTLHHAPPDGGRWTTRTLAREVGVSAATVQRVWSQKGLSPERSASFRLRGSGAYEELSERIFAVYLNPPEHAVVIASPAAGGRAPDIPKLVFAAASEATAGVGWRARAHRKSMFQRFLRELLRVAPEGNTLHVFVGHCPPYQRSIIDRWQAKHPSFVFVVGREA